ncbi:AraC-type DNA-binding protein [Dyadobacter koreensis]|uniref:AraC-type DNA-binding protein n=1 Tax=Dyadobacter koreensis TaxID=408657 RepID=A0A1H6XBK7_9BACT|nr:AraC family transcriptional regulator [Dyadobacter koreensis]SEJ26533.1 AraC-type DNA-binding protein [Dyadobacter koreensis]
MRPHKLQVATSPNRSFSVRKELIPNINSRWHCHQEVELICFHKGSGTQFVGDDIRPFYAGDVVLVGANLPHYWHYDLEDSAETGSVEKPYSTVIHFTETFWGEQFLCLAENAVLKNVLEKAKRGISLKGETGSTVISLMEKLHSAEGPRRVLLLIECLIAANLADENDWLASLGFRNDSLEQENERINAIYKYTLNNFTEKIKLETIASIAGLSPNSFCRYFKSRTGKQFSQFVTEIRVGYACKMLINNNRSIKQICYESGFQNTTCFHKQFKQITGKTPASYVLAFSNK